MYPEYVYKDRYFEKIRKIVRSHVIGEKGKEIMTWHLEELKKRAAHLIEQRTHQQE